MLDRALYVAACLLVPLAWGLAVTLATRWLESRAPQPKPVEERLPADIEYYI